MRISRIGTGVLPVIVGLGLGFGIMAPRGAYTSLDTEGEPLKAAFNADSDKVRVVMLVAPT